MDFSFPAALIERVRSQRSLISPFLTCRLLLSRGGRRESPKLFRSSFLFLNPIVLENLVWALVKRQPVHSWATTLALGIHSSFFFPRFFPVPKPAISISWCFHHLPKAQIHSNTLETVASAWTPAASTTTATVTTAPSSARTITATLSLSVGRLSRLTRPLPKGASPLGPHLPGVCIRMVLVRSGRRIVPSLPSACPVLRRPCAAVSQVYHEPCRQSSKLRAAARAPAGASHAFSAHGGMELRTRS